MHADLGLRANVDELLGKPARNARPELLELANDYLEFIRRNPPFRSAQQLIDSYRAELERRHQPERTRR